MDQNYRFGQKKEREKDRKKERTKDGKIACTLRKDAEGKYLK
jgi:hypothetical protein